MFTLTMTGTILDGKADDFASVAKQAMAATPEGADGCLAYRIHVAPDRAGFLLYEQWADDESVNRHLAVLFDVLGPANEGGFLPGVWDDCVSGIAADVWIAVEGS